MPVLSAVLWMLDYLGELAWLYVWAFVASVQLVMVFIAPVLILPLFNKFEPLPDGELKDAIDDYAAKMAFKYEGIYSMDGSKRSAHSNAFFTGFGKFKRIALFDTLIKQTSTEELVAVLAHEIGHSKKGHITMSIAIQFAYMFVLFLGLSRNMLENMKPYAKDRTMAPLVDSFMMVVLVFGALFMVFLLAIDITLQLVRLYFRFIEGEGKYGARQILELLDLDKKTKRIQEKGLFVISIKRKQQFQKWLTKTATEEEKDLAFIAFHALHKFIMMRRKEQQDATIRRMSRVPIVGKVIASIWMQRDARRGRRRAARDSVRASIRRDSLFSSRSTESRETRASGVGLSELSVEQTTGRRGSITTRFMSNFRSKRSGESDMSLSSTAMSMSTSAVHRHAGPARGTPPPSAPPSAPGRRRLRRSLLRRAGARGRRPSPCTAGALARAPPPSLRRRASLRPNSNAPTASP